MRRQSIEGSSDILLKSHQLITYTIKNNVKKESQMMWGTPWLMVLKSCKKKLMWEDLGRNSVKHEIRGIYNENENQIAVGTRQIDKI